MAKVRDIPPIPFPPFSFRIASLPLMQCISSSRPSPSPDVHNSSPHFEDSIVRPRERRIPSGYTYLFSSHEESYVLMPPHTDHFSVVTPSRSYFHRLLLAITALLFSSLFTLSFFSYRSQSPLSSLLESSLRILWFSFR